MTETSRSADASIVRTHSFAMSELPTALRSARERIDEPIKLVVHKGPAAE